MITILVIDADPAVRLAARRVLEPAGFTVIAVSDAAAALVRLSVLRADLVICDSHALAPDGSSAVGALADLAPPAPLPPPFPHHSDPPGPPPPRGKPPRH